MLFKSHPIFKKQGGIIQPVFSDNPINQQGHWVMIPADCHTAVKLMSPLSPALA